MKNPDLQSGAALLTVLSVLGVMGILVAMIMSQGRNDIGPWAHEIEKTQATYLAESGIAYQLYLEKFSDSAEPSFSPKKTNEIEPEPIAEDPGKLGLLNAVTDTFQFRLDTLLHQPSVNVDRNRAFLEMTAIGKYRNTEVTVHVRFGKALDETIFGPALTLQNPLPLEPFPPEQIKGDLRLKLPIPAVKSLPWLDSLNVLSYASTFTDSKYNGMEALLQKKLSAEGGEWGNGNFSPKDPPQFSKTGDLVFPLGQVEFVNDEDKTWVIKGPGRIFADGEIRIRGLIRLENIQLYSGKNITFEDSITGSDNTVYARGDIYLHDRCNLGLEALAGRSIVLRNRSQTALSSVLISVENSAKQKGPDSVNAIRVVNEAVARGFLIAAGINGRVVLGTPLNVVEGVVIASSVWLAGEVRGSVLTQKLLCEGTNTRNCLGAGKINRSLLPPNFVQPLQLGTQNRRLYNFKLLSWQRS